MKKYCTSTRIFRIKTDYTIVGEVVEDMVRMWEHKMVQPLW